MPTGAGGYANKSGDHALDCTDDGWLTEEDDVEPGPDKEAGGGADVGVENSHGGVDVGGVRISAVETSPTHPQQPCSGQLHDTPLKQETTAPQAESADGVRKRQPQRHKRHPRLDVHSPQQ
ncbi:hypothetical protein Ccrd_020301 [Cynara cardunculus var. scolymus]|uniref:Uncharacterized protein n=1 Tax=Cynara cardunculus var. scolymus TaxID=59895 RepID=A0A118K0G8_CYNCS|nr:hypothetical protein Ccrd_020301 [Cynara cardunculus var. scolymus]